jgi:hypothetical protein
VHHSVVDTGGKWKKSSIRKVLIILFGYFWVVGLNIYTYFFSSSSYKGVSSLILFTLFATSVTRGKFTSGVFDSGGNLPPVLFTPISMTLGVLVAKFTPVSLIPVMHLDFQISPRILENLK